MVTVLGSINYGLVLIYGVLLSVDFAGGCASKKERYAVALLSFIIFAAQMLSYTLWGLANTKKLYPLISHFPLFLMLTFALKKPWGVALASVLTAYFCCQLPRWIGALSLCLFGTQLAYQAGYLLSIVPLYIFLQRYFTIAAHRAMTYSKRSLLLFGGLPLFYYIFDYTTTVYTKALYAGVRMVNEFLPTAMALFFVAFVAVYHAEVQRRTQLEMDNAMLAGQSRRAKNEMLALQQVQQQTAIYRHDMRHHLALLSGYLEAGEIRKASEYIRQTQADIDKLVPARYCENDTVNLILSSFAKKAKQQGVTLSAQANIPAVLPLSDTELCALLSNGLENAVFAASQMHGDGEKTVRFNCQPHKDKLLIYISNPYPGIVSMRDGLPENTQPKHGFGAKSIGMIVENHKGYCLFEAQDGLFMLKVVLPLREKE
ncbi:MAG: GHKL domain-containing protein [Clostridia bacterium]|nr:GHKL domain-containing protein [Clostridia bacterium]